MADKVNGSGAGELRFDLSGVTAAEMHEFFRASRENDVKTLAGTFAKVCVACPYGDPRDPATYENLPFYGAFQDVLEGMVDAAKNMRRR